jgi:hypothetical protein
LRREKRYRKSVRDGFDAFVCNVDRTARNTNLLVWHKKV